MLAPRILIADPDAWQAAWSMFSTARRTLPVVIANADAVDLRALLGQRTTPPPLDQGQGDVWVIEPGESLRRGRWVALAAD